MQALGLSDDTKHSSRHETSTVVSMCFRYRNTPYILNIKHIKTLNPWKEKEKLVVEGRLDLKGTSETVNSIKLAD
jgi:hypothetical protein